MAGGMWTRREVAAALFAGALAMAARPDRRLAARERVFDFAIAGGWHHGLHGMRGGLVPGTLLPLRAEPGNPYDPFAVEVLHGTGVKLGYVPRAANQPVAALLAAGRSLAAEVVAPLRIGREADIPDDLVFTGFTDGDPLLRLWLLPA